VSYSERHAPKHAPAGAEIPSGVRRALLQWFGEHGIESKEIWRRLHQRIGWGSPQDIVNDVEERFGSAAARRAEEELMDEAKARRPVPWDYMPRYAIPALDSIPAPLFLDALEIGVQLARASVDTSQAPYRPRPGAPLQKRHLDTPAIKEINRIFTLRGIHYRFDTDAQAQWHGDEGAFQTVVAPALAALGDPRLAGAAEEFGNALLGLRQGTRQGEKDAIRDASNAVESTMKALLDAHAVPRQGNETANPLWELLSKAAIVGAKTGDPICSAPRLRNAYGGHGQGQPVVVPPGIPELAVQAAASAIGYLARLLT
jgi:hypothetical protein